MKTRRILMSALRVMSRIICDLVCVFSGAGLEYTTGDSHSLKWIWLLPEDLKRSPLLHRITGFGHCSVSTNLLVEI